MTPAPKKNINSLSLSIFKASYMNDKYLLSLIISGFRMTAINGAIEKTPIISKNPISRIPKKRK
jgi:hypothetical protein